MMGHRFQIVCLHLSSLSNRSTIQGANNLLYVIDFIKDPYMMIFGNNKELNKERQK